jgi:3-hydroxyacyl-CoA dehydrogenase
VRAVVLMCAGKTFFSGADISEFSGRREEAYRALFGRLEGWRSRSSRRCGTVFSGGVEIALACHYRIASPGTRFRAARSRSGSFPARAARSACLD